MNKPVLAIVEISFSSPISQKEKTQEIEDILRCVDNVNNLSIQSDRIAFYIWADEKIDFKLLDKIKTELHLHKFSNFTISASEYMKSAGSYLYEDK